MSSTHKVECVPVSLSKHSNADTLSVINVYGYTVVGRTSDWEGVAKALYIPPDSIVNTDLPEFSFLKVEGKDKWVRIKAKRLRGIWSFGLLIPAPANANIGEDFAEHLEVKHYDPVEHADIRSQAPDSETPPKVFSSLGKYDVDAFRRYYSVFNAGEIVVITEKIHGANSRYSYTDGRWWAGSRSQWKQEKEGNCPFWRQYKQYEGLGRFCKDHPDAIVYGEIYGQVQNLKYGVAPGEIRFAAFDIRHANGSFLDCDLFSQFCNLYGIPTVPHLFTGEYSFDNVINHSVGNSTIKGANHIREGCVVKPVLERWNEQCGRVCLKVINPAYLEKDDNAPVE